MNYKKISLILSLAIFFSYGIAFAESPNATSTSGTQEEKPLSQIERLVADHTPQVIKNVVESTTELIEEFRVKGYNSTLAKEIVVQAQIDLLLGNTEPINPLDPTGTEHKPNPLKLPWLKLELLVLKLTEVFFHYKIAFYGSAFLILALILRYIFG